MHLKIPARPSPTNHDPIPADPDRGSHADRAITALSGRTSFGDYAACRLWICSVSAFPEAWRASNFSCNLLKGFQVAKLRDYESLISRFDWFLIWRSRTLHSIMICLLGGLLGSRDEDMRYLTAWGNVERRIAKDVILRVGLPSHNCDAWIQLGTEHLASQLTSVPLLPLPEETCVRSLLPTAEFHPPFPTIGWSRKRPYGAFEVFPVIRNEGSISKSAVKYCLSKQDCSLIHSNHELDISTKRHRGQCVSVIQANMRQVLRTNDVWLLCSTALLLGLSGEFLPR